MLCTVGTDTDPGKVCVQTRSLGVKKRLGGYDIIGIFTSAQDTHHASSVCSGVFDITGL